MLPVNVIHIGKPISRLGGEDRSSVVIAAMQTLSKVRNTPEFATWVEREMQDIFPYQGLLCGLGKLKDGKWKLLRVFTHQFPGSYVNSFTSPVTGDYECPFLMQWTQTQEPLCHDLEAHSGESVGYLAQIRSAGIHNIAIHGGIDGVSGTGHFVLIANLGRLAGSCGLLEVLIPGLSAAFLRIAVDLPHNPHEGSLLGGFAKELTVCEAKIARWLAEGKSNWEIAAILGKSENTIKHQVTRLLGKLGVRNRVQAAVKLLTAPAGDSDYGHRVSAKPQKVGT